MRLDIESSNTCNFTRWNKKLEIVVSFLCFSFRRAQTNTRTINWYGCVYGISFSCCFGDKCIQHFRKHLLIFSILLFSLYRISVQMDDFNAAVFQPPTQFAIRYIDLLDDWKIIVWTLSQPYTKLNLNRKYLEFNLFSVLTWNQRSKHYIDCSISAPNFLDWFFLPLCQVFL